MTELWSPVKGYEGLYEVSSTGLLKSLSKVRGVGCIKQPEKILKLRSNGNGHLQVGMSKDGVSKTFYIHRIVAQSFIENLDQLPEVNHIDGDKSNNCVDNLEWCTRLHNERHAWGTGLKNMVGKNHFASKPVKQSSLSGYLIEVFESGSIAAKTTGLQASHINRCCKGTANQHGGFKWSYA